MNTQLHHLTLKIPLMFLLPEHWRSPVLQGSERPPHFKSFLEDLFVLILLKAQISKVTFKGDVFMDSKQERKKNQWFCAVWIALQRVLLSDSVTGRFILQLCDLIDGISTLSVRAPLAYCLASRCFGSYSMATLWLIPTALQQMPSVCWLNFFTVAPPVFCVPCAMGVFSILTWFPSFPFPSHRLTLSQSKL